MPDRSNKVERLNEEAGQYELPYISKSRVKQWLENPEHFRLKYLEGIEEPETQAMRRGSDIHETFEAYYNNQDQAGPATDAIDLLPDHELWADYTEPYITNFLAWEMMRKEEVDGILSEYAPVSVEEEHWRDPVLGIEGEPEWMGLADAILPAAGVPDIETDEGVVVVDFKTGKVPDPQYRSPGIYTELEYYVMLFEDKYPVVGAGAYYPRENEFILQPEMEEYREDVIEAVREMVQATRSYEGDTQFETNEGPLCKWGMDDDQESAFYGVCSQCTWGVPANNENQFRELVEQGHHAHEIAEHLGTSENAVRYWKHKLNL